MKKTIKERKRIKTMLKEGYKYGKKLGKNGQGLLNPLELTENKGRHGLG